MLAKEAAVIIGAVDAVAVAAVALVVYALDWDMELGVLLVGLIQATIVMVGAILTRGQVYSKATVDELLAEEQNDA